MKIRSSVALRTALMSASALTAMVLTAPAMAQSASSDQLNAFDALHDMASGAALFGAAPGYDLDIVANHEVSPLGPPSVLPGINSPAAQAASVYSNSPQVLDAPGSITGVGQQIAFIQTGPTAAGLSLCSGTLINARTVITAAHCLYNNPAHRYGSNTGTGGGVNGAFGPGGAILTTNGIPLSFGFESLNRNCFNADGLPFTCPAGQFGPYETWRNGNFQTSVARHIYNANQVWYGTGAQPVALGGGGEFANQDIALVTLDTHVQDIPTWAMLFSPLDGPTHVTISGYGGAGVGLSGMGNIAGIDYRRRSAENMIDALMTNNDWVDSPAINPGNTAFASNQHPIYWLDFDDPDWDVDNLPSNFFTNTAPAGGRNNGYYDFNGLGGVTLANEGATAGGDSGGPLIVDDRWSIPVLAGVLTGSWSFNGGISTYGQFNVYPPLFQFWEEIVQNNPYKYASALAGDGDWTDPTHWVQDMDPNYMVIGAGGDLVNALPSTAQGGADGAVAKFGTLCFLEADCTTMTGPPNTPYNGTSHYTAGGPGTTNFVPNNVEPDNDANPALHVKAKYYDVSLHRAGKTTLSANVTIDKLTIAGSARLNIASSGTLNVWGDYNQLGGLLNIDGTLNTSEAFVAAGLLSGSGLFNPTYLTVLAGGVGPGGGDRVGQLTVQGDMIMSSASSLFVDVRRGGADRLIIVGDGPSDDNTLTLSQNATTGARPAVVFNKVTDAPAPRANEAWVIAQADGGISGTFGTVYTFQGVLRPELTYAANTITATLRAGSLVEILDGGSATELAFANALDQLRSGFYDKLWNLYGNVDWMNSEQLKTTFGALSPAGIVGETQLLQDRQSRQLLGNVGDRLSLLGTGRAAGISFTGSASSLAQNRGGLSASAQLGLAPGGKSVIIPAAGRISGFVAMGSDTSRSSYGAAKGIDAGRHSRYFASGIEAPMGEVMVGTAIGYAEATSNPGVDETRSKVTQAAAYASLPVGKSAYVGGFIAAERASTDINRLTTDTTSIFRLSGATHSSRYMATAEAGFRAGFGHGLLFNPRAQLGYSRYSLGGFRERGGETALELNGLTVNRIESRIGAKLDGTAKFGAWAVRPNLQADYVRLLSGAKTGMSLSFAAAPEYDFVLPLTNSGSGWMEVKGGVELSRGNFSLGLSGQATAGDAPISDQRGAVDLTFRF